MNATIKTKMMRTAMSTALMAAAMALPTGPEAREAHLLGQQVRAVRGQRVRL